MKIKDLKNIIDTYCSDSDNVNIYFKQFADGLFNQIEVEKVYRDSVTEELIIECKKYGN